jgi:hypothetical protein
MKNDYISLLRLGHTLLSIRNRFGEDMVRMALQKLMFRMSCRRYARMLRDCERRGMWLP